MIYIIEGIDRLGKDTLIQGIINDLGYHEVIHKSKPEMLDIYEHQLGIYQYESFRHMMQLIRISIQADLPMIFNRGHLGECVYSPMYRGYAGEYVFDLESSIITPPNLSAKNLKLILLKTSNFNILTDDGDSFCVDNREVEQNKFLSAFEQSLIHHKIIIDVHDGAGNFKTKNAILKEACTFN